MNNKIITLTIALIVWVGALSVINVNVVAQKKFEGYWEQKSTTTSTIALQPPQKIETEKVFYKTGKMKNTKLTAGQAIIIRLDKELVWNIDNNRKSYTEITFAEMQQMSQKFQSAMKESMKDMTPEEQKMMERFMGKKAGEMFSDDGLKLDISIKWTGKKKAILGYNCEQVNFLLNNKPMMEMWITDKYNLGEEFMVMYQKIAFLKGNLSEEAKKIRGIPLITKFQTDMGMGKIESESEVTKIVETSVSDSEFEVPNGYKKESTDFRFEK